MIDNRNKFKSQAYHEAGHVVFGIIEGKRLQKVEIGLGDHQNDGCTTWDIPNLPNENLTLELIKPECLNYLAGKEVEDCFAPGDTYSSHFRDYAEVTLLCHRVPGISEAECKKTWIEEIRQTIKRKEVKDAIKAIAERLLAESTLSGDAATTIVRAHIIREK